MQLTSMIIFHICVVDASIFTVAQLRYYLRINLEEYPDGNRQHLVDLYRKHLAGRFCPESQRFDWPGKYFTIHLSPPIPLIPRAPWLIISWTAGTAPSNLNVPGLKQILTEYKVKVQSSDRRNVLEDLYNSLKTSLQEKKVIQKTGQC
jgi:hypothetical protein